MKQEATKVKDLELNKRSKANSNKNSIYKWILYSLTILTAIAIIFAIVSVFLNAFKVVNENDISWWDIFFGSQFDGVLGIISIGIIIFNTIWLALLATLVATPIAIGNALIITRFLPKKLSSIMFSIVAILAAIPSVIYGAFGFYVLDPFNVNVFNSEAASLLTMVMMVALMIMPTITIMTVASIKLTDTKMEDSSYALGANKTQTSFYITLKMARTGIFTGILFAVGRCLAETTAISMVGSPTGTEGITLSLWQQSLFLGPALLAANGGEIHASFPVAPLISMFLLFTTLTVFGFMKFIEFKNERNNVIRKQSQKYAIENKTLEKYEKSGIESLSSKEQSLLISVNRRERLIERQNEFFSRPEIAARTILQSSTISRTAKFEKHKSKTSKKHNTFTYIAAIIGIILLVGILLFLFRGGFEHLTWETLTYRGYQKTSSSQYMIYGMAVPIMGTLLTIIIAMSIALPIGIALGICLSTYLNKDTKKGWLSSYIFQMLTSIPSIVWATIAAALFAGTIIDENFVGIEPILFLSVVILPSIIKSVEEAGGRVKNNLVEGSYALGASTLTTTRRIYIKEVMPSIISGALLAISICMAESTIFISLLPPAKTSTDISSWISNGGKTMATAIWDIRNNFPIIEYPEATNYIKTFGIVLMAIILTTSFISTQVSSKKYVEAGLLGLALIIVPFSFYINPYEGSPILFVTALVLAAISVVVIPLVKALGGQKWKTKGY